MRYLVPICFCVFAAVLVFVPLTAGNEYELRLFMLFLIYAIIAVGLNVLVGLTGLVSLGQAGLFALGAYSGAILCWLIRRCGFAASISRS
jgi:ABC-type branched-subunit amino acid transport system permease subunit